MQIYKNIHRKTPQTSLKTLPHHSAEWNQATNKMDCKFVLFVIFNISFLRMKGSSSPVARRSIFCHGGIFSLALQELFSCTWHDHFQLIPILGKRVGDFFLSQVNSKFADSAFKVSPSPDSLRKQAIMSSGKHLQGQSGGTKNGRPRPSPKSEHLQSDPIQ